MRVTALNMRGGEKSLVPDWLRALDLCGAEEPSRVVSDTSPMPLSGSGSPACRGGLRFVAGYDYSDATATVANLFQTKHLLFPTMGTMAIIWKGSRM